MSDALEVAKRHRDAARSPGVKRYWERVIQDILAK